MKLAFLHIEKTGGSALREVLGNKILEVPKEHRHAGWDYLQQFKLPIVTIIRHPVDRAISHFHFGMKHWPGMQEWADKYGGNPTIFDFYLDRPNHSCQWNRQARLLAGSVADAISNLRQCFWVGVTENLSIPRTNVGQYPDYSPRDRELIASYCREDFEVYREACSISEAMDDDRFLGR